MLKITLAAALAASAFSPVLAAPRTAVVRTADLNIGSLAGRATLERRISQAATHVCGTAEQRNLKASQAMAECKADAVSKARAQAGLNDGPVMVAAR